MLTTITYTNDRRMNIEVGLMLEVRQNMQKQVQ